MKIYTPCWGEKHIALLDKCLGKSLSWPRNNKAIENSEWIFLIGAESEIKQITAIASRISPTSKITFQAGGRLVDALVQVMHSCIQDNEPMLMATPDFIYGDGTIDTFKAVANRPGLCVSIAHMRVLPDVLSYLTFVPTNPQLIDLGSHWPHISWERSEEGCKDSMSYLGGIRWSNLSNGICAVRHFLPSPFFCNFLEKDLSVFTGTDFVHWDHTWPANLLMEGRLRYIGSSDAACMIEVTDPDLNVPEVGEGEGYFRNFFHNNMQKQFVSIFRSE